MNSINQCAVVFEHRAHFLPVAVFMGLLATIETWFDLRTDEKSLGVIFHDQHHTGALYTIDTFTHPHIKEPSVAFQSDYLEWERSYDKATFSSLIQRFRMMLKDPSIPDEFTVLTFLQGETEYGVCVYPEGVFHAPDEKHIIEKILQ